MQRNFRFEAFHNAIRILHNLSPDDVGDVVAEHFKASGFIPSDAAVEQAKAIIAFRENPYEWFVRAPGSVSQAVYETLINPRQPEQLKDKPVSFWFGFDPGTGDYSVALAVGIPGPDGKPVLWKLLDDPSAN